MESRAKLFGHPIHPMLIVLPLGLLSAAVIFDIVGYVTGVATFHVVAFWNLAAGIIGGLLAAPFGLIDWLAVPSGTRAKRIGLLHGGGNVVVLALFAVAWFLRLPAVDYVPGLPAFLVQLGGLGLAGVTGWLGGELVDRLGVGVDPGANVDAPSALTDEPIPLDQRRERAA